MKGFESRKGKVGGFLVRSVEVLMLIQKLEFRNACEVGVGPLGDLEIRPLVLPKVEASVLLLLMVVPALLKIWKHEVKILRNELGEAEVAHLDPLLSRCHVLPSLFWSHPETISIRNEVHADGHELVCSSKMLLSC